MELIFNPNWWFRNYGISFDQPFYFDLRARIANDVTMRRAMHERFGIGEANPEPRPVVGSQFVAGGFVIPALFGVEVRFEANQAPCPVAANLSREQVMALRKPEIETAWPMAQWIGDMDQLEKEFGYVIGDFDLDGLLNTALQIRGNQLFLDMVEDRELVEHLFTLIGDLQVAVARYVRSRTGTCAVSVNRSIVNVDPAIYVHANCAMQMLSPRMYRQALLEHECRLAARLAPFGIHHCGDNMHLYAADYARTGAVFYDVGWGSDVARSAAALPDAFLNLRLSPVRMLQLTEDEVRADVRGLLAAAGRTRQVGLCCINMDYGTPDRNVLALLDEARQ